MSGERLGHDPGYSTIRIPPFLRVSLLAGCFERYEKEFAAGLLLVVCRERRSWRLPIGPNEIMEAVMKTKDGALMASLPMRPDFYGLKAMGVVSITNLGSISLREKFFERIEPALSIWDTVKLEHEAFYRWQDDGGALREGEV